MPVNSTQSTPLRHPQTVTTNAPTQSINSSTAMIGATAGFGAICVMAVIVTTLMIVHLIHLYRSRRDEMLLSPLHSRAGSRVRFCRQVHVVTITELVPETNQTLELNPQNTGDWDQTKNGD